MNLIHHLLLFIFLFLCFNSQAQSLKFENIIYGKAVAIKDYPYMAYVKVNSKVRCSGAFISDRHVISSLRCLLKPNNSGFLGNCMTITGGETNVLKKSETSFVASVTKAFILKEFHRLGLENHSEGDIVVYLMDKVLPPNSNFVKPITLPDPLPTLQSHFLTGLDLIFTGFGTNNFIIVVKDFSIKPKPRSWGKLRMSKAVIRPMNECEDSFKLNFDNTNQICTKLKQTSSKGAKGSCLGDNGGPLVSKKGNDYILVGILSLISNKCDEQIGAALHTRIAAYRGFIDNILNGYPDTQRVTLEYENDPSCLTLTFE